MTYISREYITKLFKMISRSLQKPKHIDQFIEWLKKNTTVIKIADNSRTENKNYLILGHGYTDRFNKAHLIGFENECHVQVDLTSLEENWEVIWQSFGNKWNKKRQNYRFLYDSFKLFYYSFEQLNHNKKLSINYRDANRQQYLNMLTGINLYGMYHHGKKCIDLLHRLKLIKSKNNKTFCKKFSETRNKFIEHNYNPNGFTHFQLETSIWSTISTNSLMEIYIHDVNIKHERTHDIFIDYYQDYFDLEMLITNIIKSCVRN